MKDLEQNYKFIMLETKFISSLIYFPSITDSLLFLTITITSFLLVNRLISDLNCHGPWGIPILGYFSFLKENYHIQLLNLTKQYGDPYIISFCGKRFLHLSSHDTVREAHVKNGVCFPGRCQDFSLSSYIFENGIAFQNDEPWRVGRRFLIKSMRELGLGARDQLKDPISDSVRSVINILNEKKGQPVDISTLLAVQCSKVIRRLLVGDHVSSDTIRKINSAYLLTLLPMEGKGFLLYGNFNRYLIAPWIKGFNDVFKAKKEMDDLFTEVLKDHKANFDPDDPKDFVDLYLRERKLREEKGDHQAQYFTDKSFIPTLTQVFRDGGLTVGYVLASFVKDLSGRIDIQNAMYEEIIREIGTERLPTFEDRNKLSFVNAVIKELERTSNLVPLAPSLECSCDTIISGVYVPKGTITLLNLHAIHNNPSVYKNPERFDPTRFLPTKDSKHLKEELPLTFNIGKRSCPGEELVSTEVFLFLTTLMQHFTLKLVNDNELKAKSKSSEIRNTMKIQVIAAPRNSSV